MKGCALRTCLHESEPGQPGPSFIIHLPPPRRRTVSTALLPHSKPACLLRPTASTRSQLLCLLAPSPAPRAVSRSAGPSPRQSAALSSRVHLRRGLPTGLCPETYPSRQMVAMLCVLPAFQTRWLCSDRGWVMCGVCVKAHGVQAVVPGLSGRCMSQIHC